jgi:hypothetical protein
MIVKFDHADQHTAGTLWMNESVAAPRVAEGMANELAAPFDDLIASVVQIFDLKANVVKTRTARSKILPKMRIGPEGANDFEPHAAIALVVI